MKYTIHVKKELKFYSAERGQNGHHSQNFIPKPTVTFRRGSYVSLMLANCEGVLPKLPNVEKISTSICHCMPDCFIFSLSVEIYLFKLSQLQLKFGNHEVLSEITDTRQKSLVRFEVSTHTTTMMQKTLFNV